MSKKRLCTLCKTEECGDDSPSQPSDLLSGKEDKIGNLSLLPNEVIGLVLRRLSLKELSLFTLTNKWMRDFVLYYFFESRTGLKLLLGKHFEAIDATTSDQQKERVQVFQQLGLLLKRMTCLLPTLKRLEILANVFIRLDGIPKVSPEASKNHLMRFIFMCYGRLLHQFVAGWDDSELKIVYEILLRVIPMEKTIEKALQKPVGSKHSTEYYVRCFFRMMFLDPAVEGDKKTFTDSCFWMKRILKKRSLENRAKLMTIIYGPLISSSPNKLTTPYIGWWDLTDSFFIENGLFELGIALYVLYQDRKGNEKKKGKVMELMQNIIRVPENWLMENVAALLYHSGDELIFDFLSNKLKRREYTEVAQHLVYMAVVTFKLEKETRVVYKMIEKLSTDEHKANLCNEIPTAFAEAITEAENAVELEDERDVIEIHDIVDANNDLLKFYMTRPDVDSSQSSTESMDDSKCSTEDNNDSEVSVEE